MHGQTAESAIPISPWSDQAALTSPDGRFRAIYEHGVEIAMSAPTCGRLRIAFLDAKRMDRIVSNDAAASMIWSDDSRFLAFARWTHRRDQALCVLRMADLTVDESPDAFSVLEFHAFSEGRLAGVDSPVHLPRHFSIAYAAAAPTDGPRG